VISAKFSSTSERRDF